MDTPPSPALPRAVRPILRRARTRYHRLRPSDRPPLDQAASAAGLFGAEELVELARAGYWPLPAEAMAWLRERPGRARRRRLTCLFAGLVTLARHHPRQMRLLLEMITREAA
jgi:hypothetical protein